ncbi:MAG TPA: zinc-binding dehydrogenase [Thermoplasmata archaeon]|nr:zinc-binding dehydrogenase [Thermoplasmata archaeon]
MIGLGFHEHGGLDRLRLVEIPEPTAGPGEVRLRVRAAAFNRLDRFTLEGIPGVPVATPHVVGSDGAGEVDAVGEGVSGLSPGARVLLDPGISDGTCAACQRGEESLCRAFRIVGEHTQGTAAPFVVVPARNVYPLPPSLEYTTAAAAPLVFQTAHRALLTVGELRPNERVAIVGAGGGVATAAIQVAKAAGARVAVTTRSPAKAERAIALGADTAVVLTEGEAVDHALWTWSEKEGVDLIFDSVGAASVPKTARALARGGRLVVIGATSGPVVELDLRTIFWRQASVRGSTMANRREFGEVLARLGSGTYRPVIDRVFPWSEAVAAFHRMFAPDLFGKVVLETPP